MDKLFIESLDELGIEDYEQLFGEEVRPELVVGLDYNSTVRCHDRIWRPFRDAQSHGLRVCDTTETEDSLDPADKEGYVDY
jgi:hypothetical protein